jgi:uncharacterized protein (TIGR00725 family)
VATPDTQLRLDRGAGRLWQGDRLFEPPSRTWGPARGAPGGGEVAPGDAVAWLQRDSGSPCRVPVGVIGPRAAGPDHLRTAEEIGVGLARCGLTVLCGGREGVMEAVCRGAAREGGLSVGLLPDADPGEANPHVTVPIATGIGVARNALIARASLCLVAIGGGHGTTAEMAFGLQFGSPVLALLDAPALAGARPCADAATALDAVARIALGLIP